MAWDTTILTPSAISKLTMKSGQEFTDVTGAVINKWSYKRPEKIEVVDYFLNFGDIIWKGRSMNVELGLHKMITRDIMKRTGMTYAEVMDEAFEMAEYGENPPIVLDKLQPNSKL